MKVVKIGQFKQGNQFAQVRKGSRITREFGVQRNDGSMIQWDDQSSDRDPQIWNSKGEAEMVVMAIEFGMDEEKARGRDWSQADFEFKMNKKTKGIEFARQKFQERM